MADEHECERSLEEQTDEFQVSLVPSDGEWFVEVAYYNNDGAPDDCVNVHGPFASQWEAGQFASTVTPETPVATEKELG